MHPRTLLPCLVGLVAGVAGCVCPTAWFPEPPAADTAIGPPVAEQEKPHPEREPAPAPAGPLKIGVQSGILLALQNHRGLKVERLNPLIQRTFEDQERAAFDPVLGAQLSRSKTKSQRLARAGATTESLVSKGTSAAATLDQRLPTGTTLAAEATHDLTDSSLYSDRFGASRLGLTLTQALLNGSGVAVNLASLRQARLDTRISEFELRGFGEALVADIERTYWDYALAQRQIDIFTQSVALAEQQLRDTQDRIRIGKLAETELAAAQAEVALRREALINARSTLATTHLKLLRLLNPPGPGLWTRELQFEDQPTIPDATLDDVAAHVEVALRMRPDLNEARLRVHRGDIELVRTRNGLLPRLDLFITLGKSGYADSFGRSVSDLDGESYDLAGGLAFEYPLGNREPRARHQRAVLSRRQAAEAVDNLVQLVEVDVRAAYIEVQRAREQVVATAATRKLQEETLRAETEKFSVGKSTTFLVAQAQRDLVASQNAEVEAVVNLLKGIVDLYRLEGSLLERRGVQAPGRQPVEPFGEPPVATP